MMYGRMNEKKKFSSKFRKTMKKSISLLLSLAMITGSLSLSDLTSVTAYADVLDGQVYASAAVYELGTGKTVDAATLFSPETGYGFSDVSYPNEAAGWVGSVYTPREAVIESGKASYVTSMEGYLAIGSKVWTETESTGYGVYTYENTSTLDFVLPNANYTVEVELVNPTENPLTVGLEAEDITKVSAITVNSGETVNRSFTACLVDGTLNLKFLENSTATSTITEADAQLKNVYVSKVTITAQAAKEAGTKPTVYLASDSTVQTYDSGYYPQTGWGQVLYSFFEGADNMIESECEACDYSQAQTYETSSVIIENRAIGGRSSKSFITEGKLDDILEDIKPGDYLFVQWGHNDATYSRPNRYVSSSEFEQWMQYYVDAALERGAIPVLVTPVARYSYNADGTFNISFNAYREVMLKMAAEQNVPVLDLGKASTELCESFGIEGSKSLFLWLNAGDYEGAYSGGVSDSTHLQYYGAYKFAQCLAKLIIASDNTALAGLQAIIPAIAVPETTPAQPTSLETTTIGASSVTISWEGTEDAELYYVYRTELTDGQTAADVDFSSAEKYSVSTITKYTDANCEGGHTYAYAVAGFNEKGVGEKSEVLVVSTKSSLYKYDFCSAATDPTMDGWLQVVSSQMYDASVGYGWISAPNNGRYRSGNGNADSNDMTDDFCLGAGEFAVDLPNGIYEIKITACDLLPNTSTIKPSYTAEGVSVGTISTKQAAASVSSTVTIVDGQLNIVVGGTNPYINGLEITPIQTAPTNLIYQELTIDGENANFLMNWGDVDGATEYKVYVKTKDDVSYSLLKTISQEEKASSTTLPFTALVGDTYYYYVTAVLGDGSETSMSNLLTIEVYEAIDPPAAPSGITVTNSETANMVISWDASANATRYKVYRSDRAEGTKGYTGYTIIGETRTTTFTDTDPNVTANVNWFYKVIPVGNGGSGAPSEAAMSAITTTLVRQEAETLSDRALVAVNLAGSLGAEERVTAGNTGVYLSWRLFEADENVSFTIYKNDSVLESGYTKTNYVDLNGTESDTYRVVGSTDTQLGLTAENTGVWGNQYLELQLDKPADQVMPDETIASYQANDMSVGDLDGDGKYELIVKWMPNNSKDNSHTGYTGTTILDAYDINMSTGEVVKLWRIDLGINIRSGAHYTQFQVWDMDGDGKAEILCKTADGTVDGVGTVIGDASADYRNSSGYILEGPEFLTIFNGETGAAIDTVDYTPARGNVSAWGDAYGNRVDRFLSCIAYLDGENPYAVFCRGYYTRTALTAYKYENGKLEEYWAFDTDYYTSDAELTAQGNHGLSVNDIDNDGKDEIIYGSLVINNDGTVKYSTELGHGDAMHVSDWVEWNDGLEIMQVHEHDNVAYHVEIHDAETGEIIMGYYTGKDTGRGVAADVDPTYPGAEFWSIASPSYVSDEEPSWNSTNGGMYSTSSTLENLITIAENTPASNFSIFWDGDLMSEVFDQSFDSTAYVPLTFNIVEWDYENEKTVTLIESTEAVTSNGTKGNAGLIADICGDWREEVIVRTSADDSKIRIYTSTIETEYSVPCLMENDAYRIGVAWQNIGYNQPANLSYLLSEGLLTAQLSAGSISKDKVEVLFTEASDGIYGHEVTGYEVYRADADGEYVLIDTLELDDLIIHNSSEDKDEPAEPEETVLFEEDFEGESHSFSLIASGNTAYEYWEADTSTVNANTSGHVYGVGARAGGDTGTQTTTAMAISQNATVSFDLKMDACYAGKSSNFSLLGAANRYNWLDSASEILTISAQASGNGYWGSITVNGVDITEAANVSNGTANGQSSGKGLTRDTTGWIHVTAELDFETQQIELTMTRISDDSVVYEGTVDFVDADVTSLEYIYMAAGKTYGGVFTDNIKIIETPEVEEETPEETPEEVPAAASYKYDFGTGAVKEGWTQVLLEDLYSEEKGYGLTSVDTMSYKTYSFSEDEELADVYNDCLLGWIDNGSAEFKVDVPNGTYNVTYYLGNGSGSVYNSVTAENTLITDFRHGKSDINGFYASAEVVVEDGQLNIVNTVSKSGNPSIYFSGIEIELIELAEVETPEEDDTTEGTVKTYVYKDRTVAAGMEYSYKIAAIVDGKTSHMSNPLAVTTTVDIMSVVEFTVPELVQDAVLTESQTAADLLPQTVEVVDQNNNIVETTITWDVTGLDLTTPGTYTVTGTIAGYDVPVVKTVTVVANAMSGYTPLETITAITGTTVTLPETVTVTFLNGETKDEAITWANASVDTSTVGLQTLTGSSASIAEIEINVNIVENYIVALETVYAEYTLNEEAELPQTVTATYADGKTAEVVVNWNTPLDTSALATVEISGTVEGYSEAAKLMATVAYEVYAKYDFGITGSPVAAGWTAVAGNGKGGGLTAEALGIDYTEEKGYGFTDGTKVIEGRNENYTTTAGLIEQAAYCDFLLPDGNVFRVDVPNGTYVVDVIAGSYYKNTVKVSIQGGSTNSIANAAGTYNVGSYEVTVTDGYITFEFASNSLSRTDGIIIRTVELEKAATATVTYADGVDNTELFADQKYEVNVGTATPEFEGTPSRTGYKFAGWTPEVAETVTEDVVYTAVWVKLQTVVLKIYRNNDLSEAYKTVYLPKVATGDSLDVTTIDINDYYTSEYGFRFYGYYADGGFRQYKAGNKLDFVGSRTINGYTVLNCVVIDNVKDSYTVIYNDGVASSVVFEDQTYVVTEGTVTPEFVGTPTRNGYAFTGWSQEVAETVTENVEYTAQWQKLETIQLKIYRNGDTSKAYKTVYLPGVLLGEKLDTMTIDINDYYSNENGFVFQGYYGDGGFRQYKLGNKLDIILAPKTIYGWTTLHCMVIDNEE